MRIESVTAQGFGPLVGQRLVLSPGLTVVAGDNESGKSSWHAATFAALCGRRRGRGRPTLDEQRFIDAHEPWDGGPWVVSCELTLDDGRRIELRHDLSGKVDCRATDVMLARDVSSEIMVDGSPDASAWLGLTRAGFQATACVGQAEVLRVLEAAEGLQDSLQRAASTAGTSGSAARAIGLLEDCRRSAVGRDTSAAVRPLRKALDSVALAEQRLQAAGEAHDELAVLARDQARFESEAAGALAMAESAAVDLADLAETVRVAERRALRQELSAERVRTSVTPPKRTRGPLRRAWAGAAALPALMLLAAAVVLGSPVLAGAGVVAGMIAAGAVFVLAGRLWPSTLAEAAARGDATIAQPAAGELAELRLESAERQALADSARRRHHETALRAERIDAVRCEREAVLPSTAEAEEALAAARRELARVQELDQTLGLAIEFLAKAQERVHREVVPELTGLLRRWLPVVTDGRYVDARLDPATLAVQVGGPEREFRSAQLLSHGTAEQVYLLLRVALAAQLTAGRDSCPLLLDDVTVHADPVRSRQLLELLHELSKERQIVLFAHQQHVREWAQANLDGARDCLVMLDPVLAT